MFEFEQERYQRARTRVQQLRNFYVHVAVYLFVNLLLLLINLLTDRYSLWFYWPLIGWSIAIAVHAFLVYGIGGNWEKEWEERKIRQIMEQESEMRR